MYTRTSEQIRYTSGIQGLARLHRSCISAASPTCNMYWPCILYGARSSPPPIPISLHFLAPNGGGLLLRLGPIGLTWHIASGDDARCLPAWRQTRTQYAAPFVTSSYRAEKNALSENPSDDASCVLRVIADLSPPPPRSKDTGCHQDGRLLLVQVCMEQGGQYKYIHFMYETPRSCFFYGRLISLFRPCQRARAGQSGEREAPQWLGCECESEAPCECST